MLKYTFISKSEIDTRDIAGKIINHLHPGDVVLLTGDLGAGKTTFVGGILAALGYKDHVISPTFNILKCYFEVKPNIFHIDAYRLEGQNIDIGLDEFIEGNGVTFIEWPKYIEPLIPSRSLEISLTRISDKKREIRVVDKTESFKEVFTALEEK